MKIRTITVGVSGRPAPERVLEAGRQLARAVDYFESSGWVVQNARISLPHCDSYFGRLSERAVEDLLRCLDAICRENSVDFCSIGTARAPGHIEQIASVLPIAHRLAASAEVATKELGLLKETSAAAIRAIQHVAHNTEDGFGALRFGCGFCIEPGYPFFPAAYQDEEAPCFSIGCENSDILVEAFCGAGCLEEALSGYADLLSMKYRSLEEAAIALADSLGVPYGGLDTSVAPSLCEEESITRAFRAVGVEFGSPGTVALCSAVTDVVKHVPVRRIGYCGIMLPVLEDVGLAKAADEGRYRISDLLTYTGVCGVGVDMVPIPGDFPEDRLRALIMDIAAVSLKLEKPLLLRLLPVPGKQVGEMTTFQCPYVCNGRIMEL